MGEADMGVVLAISSDVLRGYVGNTAARFALQRLSHEVWALPTITLAHHKGHDREVPALTAPESFIDETISQLERRGWLAEIDAVLVGYLATDSQAANVAAAIEFVRAARGDALVVLDPVIGDAGRLYVADAIANAIRDRLLPLADIVTPNGFELGWLASRATADSTEAIAAARGLRARECLVTSAPGAPENQVRDLLVTPDAAFACDQPAIDTNAHGAGDLMAALYLGHRLSGDVPEEALARASGGVNAVLAATAAANADELRLVAAQEGLVEVAAVPAVMRVG